MASSTTPRAFCRIAVSVSDAAEAERVAAEAYAAGAAGLEERGCGDGILLLIYAEADAADAVCGAIAAGVPGAGVEAPADVANTDWTERWKVGLTATLISPRLLIRPSFVATRLARGQAEIVIDPGQAFGTGGHPSTRLALEWIDELAPLLNRNARILDVGTGTGILALAAAKLSAAAGFAFDTDPLATAAAHENARLNGLGSRLRVFTGSLDAIGEIAFELVVANLLRTEMLPLFDGIAARVCAGGHAVFSGLLSAESESVCDALRAVGLRCVAERMLADANGDSWSAVLTIR